MHASIRWALAATLLTACNAGPGAHSTRLDTTGTLSVTRESRGGDMYFQSDTLPAASSPGRVISLTLHATGDAEKSTDYLDHFPETVEAGPWQQQGDTISMILKTLHQSRSSTDTLRFREVPHQLVYLGKDYGSAGLRLTEQSRPALQPRVLVMWVHPQKTTCTDVKGRRKECLQIAFSKAAPGAADWRPLDEDIKKFTFVPGRMQQIKVLRTPRHGQLADEHTYSYELLTVIK